MNQKYFLSIIFIVFSLPAFYFLYENYYLWNKVSSIKEIQIQTLSGSILIDQDSIEVWDAYSYYQINIYPSQFTVSCDSKNQLICDNLLGNNRELLEKYSLSYQSRALDNGIAKTEAIKFLDTKETINTFLNNAFDILYTQNQNINSDSNIESGQNTQLLNGLENDCLEWIKNDIIPGSYDYENEIQQRFEIECGSMNDAEALSYDRANIQNPPSMVDSGETKNNDINFGIQISEVRLEYTFLKKVDGVFQEKLSQSKWIPYSQKVSKPIVVNF